MKDNKVSTSWTEATSDINKAIIGLMSCLDSGKNAWIEIRKNGEQSYPIKKKNPLLNNPFNWKSSYGVPKNEKEMRDHKYFNETEKDLTYNYTSCFGTPEAIEIYQREGKIIEGLILSCGKNHPVKILDAIEYRKSITKDNYSNYGYWIYYWQPKDSIGYWVVDEDIQNVFTICYNDEPFNKQEAIQKAGEFLLNYAKEIQ